MRSNLPSQFFSNRIHLTMTHFIWSCLCFEEMLLFCFPIYLMAVFMTRFLCYVWLGVTENFSKLLVSSFYVRLDFTVHVAHPEGVSFLSFPMSLFHWASCSKAVWKMFLMDCSRNVCMWSPYSGHPIVGKQTRFLTLHLFILQRQDVYRLWSQFSTKSP